MRYLHQDHLGSVDTITDESGAVVERLSYDPFGKRRVAEGEDAWEDAALPIAVAETPRGFTDHEHLDDFQLVHMNGRVYDPVLGRFLSADPFIRLPATRRAEPFIRLAHGGRARPQAGVTQTTATTAATTASTTFARPATDIGGRIYGPAPLHSATPTLRAADILHGPGRHFYDPVPGRRLGDTFIRLPANTQGLNRYAYVANNPLSFIDPSGYYSEYGGDYADWGDSYDNEGNFNGGGPNPGDPAYSAGAAAAGSGQTDVTIGYTGTPVGIGSHPVIIGTDKVTGEQFATRAGPGWGTIKAIADVYDETFTDKPSEVHTTQTVGTLDISIDEFAARAMEFAEMTNANNVPYGVVTSNSVSYAFAFLESLGFERPTPPVWAPGWGVGTPSSELSYGGAR